MLKIVIPRVYQIIFRYIRAAKEGETILVDANALKVGKSLAFLSVDITNKESGKLIAQGRHTKHVGS